MIGKPAQNNSWKKRTSLSLIITKPDIFRFRIDEVSPFIELQVMLTATLHKRWLTRFFVLSYLLLSLGTANASFWCHEEENSSRLEFNLTGRCWTSCNTLEEDFPYSGEAAAAAATLGSAVGVDCLDTPVHSSTITRSNRTSPLNKIAPANIAAHHPSYNPAHLAEPAYFTGINSAAQLPTPQGLTTLSTVVLLH